MNLSQFGFPNQNALKIVGISGKVGAGKNWIATKALVPLGYVPLALANHFKVDAVVKGGAPILEVFGSYKSPETRHLLQQMGTELGRNVYGEDVWVRTLGAWVFTFAQNEIQKFVITDIRFPNEVKWVQDLGGKVLRITGRGGAGGPAAFHISETALDGFDGFDGTIDNNEDRDPMDVKMDVYRALGFV
jgi:hypothetical protein